MDRNTLLVLAIAAALFFGWRASLDYRFGDRNEAQPAPVTSAEAPEATVPAPPPATAPSGLAAQVPAAVVPPVAPAPERLLTIDRSLYRAVFTTRGGALREWELKKYDDSSREGDPQVSITTAAPGGLSLATPFAELGLGDLSEMAFEVGESSADHLEFHAKLGGLSVRKVYRFEPDGYGARLAIEVINETGAPVSPDFRLSWPARLGAGADFAEFGLAAYASDDLVALPITAAKSFLGFGGGPADDPVTVSPAPDEVASHELDWAGAETRYFVAAILPDNPRDARAALIPVEPGREGRLEVWFEPVALPPGARLTREYRLYLGPKEPERLDAMGAHLDESIQKGWAPFLTRFFTGMLTTTYRFVPNYGLAILLLTIVIRVALAPLMVGQMRSMKRMGELAPKIKAAQERFPDDREKQQEAMMGVYRDAGVSPFSMFGGCVPMLLQLPVFVGFYSALHGSIQLRQQPFFGWIQDLSQPESLFVIPGIDLHVRALPLLLGASMVLQQRLTPTPSMDAAQARMMQVVMPVMFTVMFYQFASGLGLYWLMSTLLGIAQQALMNRKPASQKA